MNRTVPAPIARRTRQRGIGIVGFIIGLVVGLAIALGVAVYVTQAPTPFTDTLMGKTAEQKERQRTGQQRPLEHRTSPVRETPGHPDVAHRRVMGLEASNSIHIGSNQ